jgi:hypothetical protein
MRFGYGELNSHLREVANPSLVRFSLLTRRKLSSLLSSPSHQSQPTKISPPLDPSLPRLNLSLSYRLTSPSPQPHRLHLSFVSALIDALSCCCLVVFSPRLSPLSYWYDGTLSLPPSRLLPVPPIPITSYLAHPCSVAGCFQFPIAWVLWACSNAALHLPGYRKG